MDKPEVVILRDMQATLRRIEGLLRRQAEENGVDLDRCPACGGEEFVEDAVFGEPLKVICKTCEAVLIKEAVNG